MKRSLVDPPTDTPLQTGKGGMRLKSKSTRYEEPLTAIDKTTRNAKRVLDEEAEERAEKTARLRAARKERDAGLCD